MARQAARIVALVFQQEMDGPRKARAKPRRELVEEVGPCIVFDGVDGVQAQPVEMKFLDPIFSVLNEEVANRPGGPSIELDRVAPRGSVAPREEIRRIERKEVSLRSEVVIDDVEQHRDSMLVGALNESLEGRCHGN
jgi:hypothetical protein